MKKLPEIDPLTQFAVPFDLEVIPMIVAKSLNALAPEDRLEALQTMARDIGKLLAVHFGTRELTLAAEVEAFSVSQALIDGFSELSRAIHQANDAKGRELETAARVYGAAIDKIAGSK